MILDQLKNSSKYEYISSNLKKGFEFLKNTNLSQLAPGKYEIDGMNVFALVSEYETKSHKDCRPEAHRDYADIQYIISGKEAIGYVSLQDQPVTTNYLPEKDIIFYTCKTTQLLIEAGHFAVFFPQDIHRPGMQIEVPEKVKKVVVKVKLQEK